MKKLRLTFVLFALIVLVVAYYNQGSKETYLAESRSYQIEKYSPILESSGSRKAENPDERLEFELGEMVNPLTGEIPPAIRQRELQFAKRNLNKIEQVRSSTPVGVKSSTSSTNTQTSDFINVGPFNVGGRTRAIGIDINNEDIILAGGASGGVWRSIDAGTTWTRTTALEQHPAVSSLIQDQRAGKTNEWYYGTGERISGTISINGDIYVGNGIYKSMDNGATWALIESTAVVGTSGTDVITDDRAEFAYVDDLAIDYSNTEETEVYAAVSNEIIRSTDGFETWDVVLGADNGNRGATDIAIASSGKVYATIASGNVDKGFFKSDDGINWEQIDFPSGFPASFRRIEIGVDALNEDRVFVLAPNDLFIYDDSNGSWFDLTDNLDVITDDGINGHDAQNGFNLDVHVHPANSDVVFVGGINLLRSTDGFTSDAGRKQVGGYRIGNCCTLYPNHHPDNHELAFYVSDPNKMLSATDGGVARAVDNLAGTNTITPITWESLNNGYLTTHFYHIDINNSGFGDTQIAGGMQDNSSWVRFDADPTSDWIEFGGGDGAYAAISYNSLYGSSQNGRLFRFEADENGVYQGPRLITPSENESDFIFINPYTYNQVHQDQLFVGARGRIFVTNDVRNDPGVGDWISLSGPDGFTGSVSALATSVQPEGILYFGTRTGLLYKIENTRDITEDTEIIELDVTALPVGNVSSIAIDPADGDKVVVSISNYEVISVWYSEDGGSTWGSISGNLEENPDGRGAGPQVRSVAIMPDGNGGNYYFAGTSVGLFMTQTLDGDNTVWTQQGANQIGNVIVASIVVRPIEGLVVAATHGNGVFQGTYQVGITPNIDYSLGDEPNTALLRGNVSFVEGKGMSYQWLKDGEVIDGENTSQLTVTDGGDYQLRLGIQDVEGTALSNTISFNFDGTSPDVTSITRLNPTDENTSETTVQFQVTFSEEVVNVDNTDFETSGDASGTISEVTESTAGTVFNVTVNNIGGNGTLSLDIAASTDIADAIGNIFSGTVTTEENYTIQDGTAPTAAITRVNPITELTDENRVTFMVAFTEGVQNVDVSDFALSAGSPTATLSTVTEFGTGIYSVEITDIVEDGTLGLDFVAAQDIQDNAGNVFDGTVTTDETYTIENVITSIDDPLLINVQKIIVDANPSSGIFNLAFPNTFLGDFEMQIVDTQGRVAVIQEVKRYTSGDQVALDLTSSPDGLYILKASNGLRTASIKLLKSSN